MDSGGTSCGCFYIENEKHHTDWFINKVYSLLLL